jgi:hypothetical protein
MYCKLRTTGRIQTQIAYWLCIQYHALSYTDLVALLRMTPIVQVITKVSLCTTLYHLSLSKFLLTFILLIWRNGRAINSIPIYSYIQQDATSHSLFISGNCSTYFGWYFHPSSGAHKLYLQHLLFVTPLLLSAAIVEELEPV